MLNHCGEFGATILFAGNFPGRTQTMSLAIYGRYEAGDLDTALVLAAILLLASVLVLLVGWALNCWHTVTLEDDELSLLMMLRMAGVVLWPLGGVLGYVSA